MAYRDPLHAAQLRLAAAEEELVCLRDALEGAAPDRRRLAEEAARRRTTEAALAEARQALETERRCAALDRDGETADLRANLERQRGELEGRIRLLEVKLASREEELLHALDQRDARIRRLEEEIEVLLGFSRADAGALYARRIGANEATLGEARRRLDEVASEVSRRAARAPQPSVGLEADLADARRARDAASIAAHEGICDRLRGDTDALRRKLARTSE